MLLHEVVARQQALTAALNLSPELLGWLTKTTNQRTDVLQAAGELSEINTPQHFEDLVKIVAGAQVVLARLSPGATFRALHAAQFEVSAVTNEWPLVSGVFVAFEAAIRTVEERYSTWLSDKRPSTAMACVNAAADLGILLRLGDAWAHEIDLDPSEDRFLGENLSILTLKIHSSTRAFHDVHIRLGALENAYSELSSILGVSEVEFPLQILRMEVGSLWAEIAGHKNVIGLLATAIGSAAKFLFGRFRATGSIPKGMQQLELLLTVREKMVIQGLDTSLADSDLELVYAKLTRNLVKLVGGAPQIEVDGEVVSLPEELTSNYLEATRPLLLEAENSAP